MASDLFECAGGVLEEGIFVGHEGTSVQSASLTLPLMSRQDHEGVAKVVFKQPLEGSPPVLTKLNGTLTCQAAGHQWDPLHLGLP